MLQFGNYEVYIALKIVFKITAYAPKFYLNLAKYMCTLRSI